MNNQIGKVRTVRTVLDKNYKKHPLERVWTFWVYRNIYPDFASNLSTMYDADNVEDFWRVMTYLKAPQHLTHNWGLYMFKKNVRPMWEEEVNKRGGRWVITVPKTENCDLVWREVAMLLIGEQFREYSRYVNGVCALAKGTHDRVCVWTSTFDRDICMAIGKIIQPAIENNPPFSMLYSAHDPTEHVKYKID